MMENRPPLTSLDGSSNGNSPERCPRPLDSQDSTQEHHEIPQEDQGEGLIVVKVEMKEDPSVMNDDPCEKEESSPEISLDPGDMQRTIKDEQKEESLVKIQEEETPIENITDGKCDIFNPETYVNVSSDDKTDDDEITSNSSDENPNTPNLRPVLRNSYLPSRGACSSDFSTAHKGSERFPCSDSGERSKFTSFQGARLTKESESCPKWGESFNNAEDLIGHQKTQSAGKANSCSECGKCFISKTCLTYHERTHNGEKPFSCPECGRCFTQKGHLITHQQTHTGEKPFSCPECGRCFTQRSNLSKHQRTHTGVKPHSCPECGKCFYKRGNLTAHQRTHLGDKPYSCSECRKSFTKKSYLIYHHYKTHLAEKPFSCFDCGKGFSQKEDLISHQKTHTEEKPYSCLECGKGFTRKSTLALHKRVHTGEKPYMCSECGKAFVKKASLISHLSTHQKQGIPMSEGSS